VYGPNEYFKKEMASLVFKAFHQIRETGRLKLFKSYRPEYADGEQKRDFIYVKDIAKWTMEFQKNPRLKSGVYNMGSGEARSWLDMARAIFKAMNVPMQIDWIDMPKAIREQYQYFTCANMEKMHSRGLSLPEWSLEEGIQDYIENYLLKEDPYFK
jgi:ADP-L-glycero-D-manno-heptose 6-epimerase